YTGAYGAGAATNKFFPALGDGDYSATAGITPYLNYFSLPGNERYYDFTMGPVEFFILNDNSGEPDGRTSDSPQAAWLQSELANSTATWKLVILHHPPYQSGGSNTTNRWPFQQWGASA